MIATSRLHPWPVAALLGVAVACARIEPPPGGPPDNEPPVLLVAIPESLAAYPGFRGAVRFQFNEVISEGGQASMGLGTSDLERLIILSPTRTVPSVRWKRDAIEVEPREGWLPNRVYRVELLPGVADLQRNRLQTGAVVTFTTGAPVPGDTLRGTVLDWSGGRAARVALVEAILLPDSLPYRTMTDSSGRFVLGPLPSGNYLVYGVVDQNRNQRREFREGWDSLRVASGGADSGLILWTALRDTVGPRIQSASRRDSMTVELTFNQPLSPYQRLDSTNVRVISAVADSTPVPVASLRLPSLDDSLQAELRRQADSANQPDSAAIPGVQKPTPQRPAAAGDTLLRALLARRPPLAERLVLRLADLLVPGQRYVILVQGVRNVNEVPGDSRFLLDIPEAPPPPADSTAAPPPADSAPVPVPPSGS